MSHDLDPGVTTGFHIGPVNIPADEFGIFDPPVKIGIDMQYKNHCFPELSSTKFEIPLISNLELSGKSRKGVVKQNKYWLFLRLSCFNFATRLF